MRDDAEPVGEGADGAPVVAAAGRPSPERLAQTVQPDQHGAPVAVEPHVIGPERGAAIAGCVQRRHGTRHSDHDRHSLARGDAPAVHEQLAQCGPVDLVEVEPAPIAESRHIGHDRQMLAARGEQGGRLAAERGGVEREGGKIGHGHHRRVRRRCGIRPRTRNVENSESRPPVQGERRRTRRRSSENPTRADVGWQHNSRPPT
ncbi:MAG: hypothetical protein FWD85_10855 [Microbacteriaceae bacterium]|nr:hypothetical protein [Microbacteriaceae bacterium]